MAPTDGGDTEKVPVQVRLPRGLIRKIDHLAIDWDLYRNELIEQLLMEGMKTYRGPEASRS